MAKLSMCQFGMAKCLYVRHDRFEVLKTKTQIHAFVGITGYYHWFIPNYSAMR